MTGEGGIYSCNITFALKTGQEMTNTRLQDDLMNDFREQKRLIKEQIELFDPLATSLRRPAAQRLMSKGGLIFAETFFYILCLGAIAFTAVMNIVHPFSLLSRIRYITDVPGGFRYSDKEMLSIAVHALTALIAILFFIIARIIRRVRLKNDILDLAGRNIKLLVGQHLNRKAAIDAIEQRHFVELPDFVEPGGDLQSMPNPGY
ncbi:MAG: hypothetical protein EOP49_08640 [Sphingobacteriales bacterium]|nr:MAG: hypothetical protein EOP49_08640 [Sphingobacteriales bacterium]